jgi:hypothetical protein
MVISVVAYCKDSIYPLSHGISNNELSMLVTMTMSIDYFMSILTGNILGGASGWKIYLFRRSLRLKFVSTPPNLRLYFEKWLMRHSDGAI